MLPYHRSRVKAELCRSSHGRGVVQADDLVKRCVENINFYTPQQDAGREAAVLITTPKGWNGPAEVPSR